jgi:hypothetical protein
MFLKWTILKNPKWTTEDIIDECRAHQLDWVSSAYLLGLKKTLKPPTSFRIGDKHHLPSYRFIVANGLTQICYKDRDAVCAFRMVKMPRVKEYIEALTLSGAPADAITRVLLKEKMVVCTKSAVERFRLFFWNLSLVDSTETRALLDMRVEQVAASGDPEVASQYNALKNANWSDPRRIAANLPASPFTAAISQIKVGVLPQGLDRGRLLDTTIDVMALRILECALNNGPKDSMKASEYANALRIVREIKADLLPPQDQFEKELRAISLKYNTAPLVTIAEVTGGNVTQNILPDEAVSHNNTSDDALDDEEAEAIEDLMDTEEDDGQPNGELGG